MFTLAQTYKSRQKVLGYPVDLVDQQAALQLIEEAWRLGKGLQIVTLNAEMVIAAQRDPALDRVVRRAHLIIPDGAGVVWALKWQGREVARLPGIELAHAALEMAAKSGRSIALVGGKPEILDRLKTKLKETHANLKIVASQDGYFAANQESQIVDQIARCEPELVLVALGVPKQEYFIDRWQSTLSKAVMIGVGGSFDVWTGAVKRAPVFFRRYHAEWLYRLISEPWRLSRMATALPSFALQVLFDRSANRGHGEDKPGEKKL